jgi:hypothetical protein
MARYFEFLSQFYGFHLTHPRILFELRYKRKKKVKDNKYKETKNKQKRKENERKKTENRTGRRSITEKENKESQSHREDAPRQPL